MEAKKILVTTDFSDVSYAALRNAANMKEDQITLLSIVQTGDVPPDLIKHMPNPHAIQEYRQHVLDFTKEKLESVAKQYFNELSVTIDVIVSEGNIAAEISNYAEERAMDMIVMTSQGRGAMGSLFIGSTVQRVLRSTKVPVLVVPKSHP